MKKIELYIFIILLIFSFANISNAQEVINDDYDQPIEDATVISSVELYDSEIISQENNDIDISFNLFNGGRTERGIKYGIQLISYVKVDKSERPLDEEDIFSQVQMQEVSEMQVILDEKIYEEIVTIKNNETINKNILYTAPSYLNGEFEIWLIAKNSSGILLALNNLGKILLEGDNGFVKIIPESCYLIIEGESNGEKYSISQGVDISSDENLQAVCKLTNYYNKDINFTPYFNIYNRSTFGELIKENESIQSNFVIEVGQSKIFTFNIPKVNIPQAYDAELALKEGNNNISNSVVFHYVIQGESATIQNLSLDKDYYLAGDIAEVSVYVTPSADIFYNSRAGDKKVNEFNLKLAIYDDNGNLCMDESSLYEKMIDEQAEEIQTFSINVNKDCYNPKVVATAENSSGDILAQEEYQISTESVKKEITEEQKDLIKKEKSANKYIEYAIVLIFIGLLFVILLIIRKKGKGVNLSIFLFFISVGFIFGLSVNEAKAGTFVVPGNPSARTYGYIWEMNTCSERWQDICYWDRTFPRGPFQVEPQNCPSLKNAVRNGNYQINCSGGKMYVSPGFSYTSVSPARYTVSLNKSSYSPGENIIITASAVASWCANDVTHAHLALNHNNQWTRIINYATNIPYVYTTKTITAATSPGVHNLDFYGTAYWGHASMGVIREYTMQYTVVSPCTPNCVCAANICVGQTCPNGCGGTCAGTKPLVNGGWTSWVWGAWHNVGSCGTYQLCKQRQQKDATRTCTNPAPSCGGANCSGSSSTSETQYIDCGVVNGGWTSWVWGAWHNVGSCGTYQSCKQKQQKDATRTCTNPAPSCGGANCSGSSSTSETQYIDCGLVNGVCGSADGSSFYTKPTTNLCSVGTASGVSGSGPWSWTCSALCGGTTGSCSANLKVDGSCGSADGGVFPSQPTTNLCSPGTPSAVSGTSGPCSWTCAGLCGGTPDSCSAYIDNINPTIDYFKVNNKAYGQGDVVANDSVPIIVSWKAHDDRSGVNRAEIWRQDITAGGSWQNVYQTASAESQWTDNTIINDHDYWYGIHVADNIGNLAIGSSHSPQRDPIKAIINTSPTVSAMTAPNWSFENSCSLGAKKAILRWAYNDSSGQPGTAYRLILSKTNNSGSPTEFDTGQCTGYSASPSKCKIDVSPASYQYTLESSELEYNLPYYWWVQVWDEHGQPSALTQYNTAFDTDNNDGQPNTFTTYRHEFPIVDFSWLPESPSKDEEIQFTDASKIYSDGSPASHPAPCGSCSWLWTPSNANISGQGTASPIITFNSSGSQTVTLRTTDSAGYYCGRTEAVDINISLPGWQEVK